MGSLQNYISIQPMRFAMMISVGATPSSASARPTNKFHFHPTDAVCHDDLDRGDAEQRECSPFSEQRKHPPCSAACAS